MQRLWRAKNPEKVRGYYERLRLWRATEEGRTYMKKWKAENREWMKQ